MMVHPVGDFMKFRDILVNKERRYAIEEDLESGTFYITFPVFNGLTEYSEFYKISNKELEIFLANIDLLENFVKKCKERKMDDRLLMKPGRLRGEPC
jgi:hypothetical protein